VAVAGHREAARVLSPSASANLIDQSYGVGPVKGAGVLAASCALIVAADRLVADTPARFAATR
jgi:tagatose-1,6-bisphosphate aldolase